MEDRTIGRREFLRSTTAGLGGFVYLRTAAVAPEEGATAATGAGYRVLGRTGIRLPVISMGVMNTDNPQLVRAALDAGVVHLDTAQGYQRGTNEAMIGGILKGRPRDSFVIATKASMPKDAATGTYGPDATEEAYTKKIDTSLKNLGLDHVDIYYHHGTFSRGATLHEPILTALEKAKKAGKARFVGVTTHRNEPEVLRAAVEAKLYDVVLTAYNFRQKHGAEVKAAIGEAAGAGLGVVAMKTIGGNSWGAYHGGAQLDARAAFKWALQDPNVHTIITGFTTFDQMTLDLSILKDLSLSAAERAQLQILSQTPGLYCQGCATCVGQCTAGLPIPEMMRAYMYAYGHRNLVAAQDLLFSLPVSAAACEDCTGCPVACTNGWNVRDKIGRIVRLREVPTDLIV